jgi:hypothetical protein
VLFVCAATAHALTITPVRIEIKGDPGQVLTEEMTLINEQATDVTFYSSYANFEAQGDTGTPSFTTGTEGIASWMKTADSVTLGPNETKTIRISIAIPKDATPGGYFGAIFWGTAPESDKPGEVAISAKTGMLVLLSVNGDVKEAGGLVDFKTKEDKFWYNTLPVSFEYRFRNDGGDRVKPTGKITIRNTVYLRADRIDANPVQGNILPASTRKFKVDWVKYTDPDGTPLAASAMKKFFHTVRYQWKNFAFGLYSAHIDVVYGNQNQHAKDVAWFFVFPWQLLVCIIIVLIVVRWGGKKALHHYNRLIIARARTGGYEEVE